MYYVESCIRAKPSTEETKILLSWNNEQSWKKIGGKPKQGKRACLSNPNTKWEG